MEQAWFEMRDVRRRKLQNSVWIPLRAVRQIQELGRLGRAGYLSDFFGAGSIAVPIEKRFVVEKLDWTDVGVNHNHAGWVDGDDYIPADVYRGDDGPGAVATEPSGFAVAAVRLRLAQELEIASRSF